MGTHKQAVSATIVAHRIWLFSVATVRCTKETQFQWNYLLSNKLPHAHTHTHERAHCSFSSKCEEKEKRRSHFTFVLLWKWQTKNMHQRQRVAFTWHGESNGSHNKLQQLNGNTQNVTQFSWFPWIFFYSLNLYLPNENGNDYNVHFSRSKI